MKRRSVKALLQPVALLLTVGMVSMWLASSTFAGWLFGSSFRTALLVGAVVTLTNPVVASSIVTGPFAKKHLPMRLRDSISLGRRERRRSSNR